MLSSFQKHLNWCKIWYIKDEGPKEIFESLKLQYLIFLAEKLITPTETFETDKFELLSLLSEFFIYRLNTVTCFALLNLYAGEERKKYLSTRKLTRLRDTEGNTTEDKILIDLLMVARNLSNDLYDRAISGLKEIIDLIEANEISYIRLESLYLFLGVAYFQRSFCRKKDENEKAIDANKGLEAMKKYYKIRLGINAMEANYNMGRTYHCIGNLKKAASYYSNVLIITTNRKLIQGKFGL